jgi:hypothetical protein
VGLLGSLLSWVLSAVRWLGVIALPLILWNFHHEIWSWGWSWFVNFLSTVGLPNIGLPDLGSWLTSNQLVPVLSAANEWVPLQECTIYLGGYCVLLLTLTPMKMVLRRIPGING